MRPRRCLLILHLHCLVVTCRQIGLQGSSSWPPMSRRWAVAAAAKTARTVHGQRWDRGNVTVQAFGVPELTSLAARAKTTDKSTSRQRVAVVVFNSGPFQLESSTRAARHQLHGSQRLLKPVRTQALVQVRIVNCVCANLTF